MAKILAVEDENDLRELIVEELTFAGHLVVEAENGKAGMDRLAAESVDLIVSDITMPEMNGYQFYRSVREQMPQYADTPFIFMTALADREDQMKGLRLGVDDYITKPIDFDLLQLRIETHLRRRQPVTEEPPAPAATPSKKAASDNYRSDPDATDNLQAIASEGKDPVLASRFQTIPLEKIRDRLGDQWREMGEQILRNAEMVIRAHLGPKDSLCVTPAEDFLVCFADLDDEELNTKTGIIRDEIWEKLFEITNDEELSSVDAQSFEIAADEVDDDITFTDFDDIITQQSEQEKKACKTTMGQAYHFEEIFAFPVLGPNGQPSKIKSLTFKKKIADNVKRLADILQDDGPFSFELQKTILERFRDNEKLAKAHKKQGLLIPVDFSMIRHPKLRDDLASLFTEVEQHLGVLLVIEAVRLPDRLTNSMDALTPLPGGRKLQFVELRRPQQSEGVSLGQAGVAYVSMSFDNVVAARSKGFGDFAKRLTSQGVKIFIKDVPGGQLFEAQQYHGQLFTMRK